MRENKLYQACIKQVGKYANSIGIDFRLKFSHQKEVGKDDVVKLYHSVLESVVSQEDLKLLHEAQIVLEKRTETVALAERLKKLRRTLQNGEV